MEMNQVAINMWPDMRTIKKKFATLSQLLKHVKTMRDDVKLLQLQDKFFQNQKEVKSSLL